MINEESPRVGDVVAALTELAALSLRTRLSVFEDFLDYAAAVLRVAPVAESIRDSLAKGTPFLFAVESSREFQSSPAARDLSLKYWSIDKAPALFRQALEDALWVVTWPPCISSPLGNSFIEHHGLDIFGYIYQNVLAPQDGLHLNRLAYSKSKARRSIPNGAQRVFLALEKALDRLEKEGDAADALLARSAISAAAVKRASDWRTAFDDIADTVMPLLRPYLSPFAVHDPACGSGVMLLAASQQFPAFAVEHGLVQFWGSDLDPVCVKMSHLNEVLYGLNGFFQASVEGTEPPTSLITLTAEQDVSSPRLAIPVFQEAVSKARALTDDNGTRQDRPFLRRLGAEARQALYSPENSASFPRFTDPWGENR